MTTNERAATNSATLTAFSSANSFYTVVGDSKTANEITQQPIVIPKFASGQSGLSVGHTFGQAKLIISDFIMFPKIFKKIIISPKLCTKIIKDIQKMEGRPRIRKLISYMLCGLFGHTLLALRKSSEASTTCALAITLATRPSIIPEF